MELNCVLLNADYTPLGLISWQKAIKLMVKGKVEIIKSSKKKLHNFENTITLFIPILIRLIKFVRNLWKARVPFNKRNLMIRDNFTCQYCGKKLNKDSSIDHIIPKSKGGKSTFENTVASCIPCNCKKNNHTCAEARMYPRNKAYIPTINQFLMNQIRNAGLEATLIEFGIL